MRTVRKAWKLRSALLAVIACAACGKSEGPRPAAKRDAQATVRAPSRSALQKEIDKALILESALDKAKAALTEAEQSIPRDEALIAERADGVRALEQTIKRSRQMIEVLRARESGFRE